MVVLDALEVPVPLLVWLCEGLGHGSAMTAVLDAAPNCVRQVTGRDTARAAPADSSGHVAFAAPPEATTGACWTEQRLSLSHT